MPQSLSFFTDFQAKKFDMNKAPYFLPDKSKVYEDISIKRLLCGDNKCIFQEDDLCAECQKRVTLTPLQQIDAVGVLCGNVNCNKEHSGNVACLKCKNVKYCSKKCCTIDEVRHRNECSNPPLSALKVINTMYIPEPKIDTQELIERFKLASADADRIIESRALKDADPRQRVRYYNEEDEEDVNDAIQNCVNVIGLVTEHATKFGVVDLERHVALMRSKIGTLHYSKQVSANSLFDTRIFTSDLFSSASSAPSSTSLTTTDDNSKSKQQFGGPSDVEQRGRIFLLHSFFEAQDKLTKLVKVKDKHRENLLLQLQVGSVGGENELESVEEWVNCVITITNSLINWTYPIPEDFPKKCYFLVKSIYYIEQLLGEHHSFMMDVAQTLGVNLFNEKKYAEAIQSFEKAKAAYLASNDKKRTKGNFLRQLETDITICRDQIDGRPDRPEMMIGCLQREGAACMAKHDYVEALKKFREALECLHVLRPKLIRSKENEQFYDNRF